jgi:hypothetical protein
VAAALRGMMTRRAPIPAGAHANVPKPPLREALLYGLAAAIPMVGFGFMDNVVLIVAGSNIDYYFGTSLGIHTMTAAGLGQVVSDTSGVLFGQFIENVAEVRACMRACVRARASERQQPS